MEAEEVVLEQVAREYVADAEKYKYFIFEFSTHKQNVNEIKYYISIFITFLCSQTFYENIKM